MLTLQMSSAIRTNIPASAGAAAITQQLKDVRQIQASGLAVAAILGDGFVVTCGAADCGGDSSAATGLW